MRTVARPSTNAHIDRDQLECVKGEINFVRRSPDERASALGVPGNEEVPMVTHDVTIRDAHPIVGELSLDREGFTLVQHKVSCANEPDPNILCDRYLEEMVPFIKDYFNASWVVARRQAAVVRSIGGNARPPASEANKNRVSSNAAGWAHVDYAPIAGPMLAASESQLQGVEIRSYSRLMIIQAWRPLTPPPQDFPLAFCDGSSVADSDLVIAEYKGRPVPLKYLLVRSNPLHRWYYFPKMAPDEFVLFKGYDSEDGRNARCAHSAFDDRRAYPNANPRRSIEARFCVYFD